MRTMLGSVAGLVGGLSTSLVCVAICFALQHYADFSFFTLMLWFVIPAGAAITGFAASSGYYLGAKLFDARPSVIMGLGMVAIAGLTQFLIYFATYATFPLPDGRTALEAVDYWTFVKFYLGHQRYTIGHSVNGAGVDVGNVGYAIAAVQHVGFLAGGGFTFLVLKKQPFCEKCGRYYRRRLVLSKQGGPDYIDGIRAKAAFSPDYFGALQDPQGAGFKLDVILSQCPNCAQEMVSEEVHVLEKKQWKPLPELSRRILVDEPVLHHFRLIPEAKPPRFSRLR